MDERGTLHASEPHPSAELAFDWIRTLPLSDLMLHQESLSNCAIEGNRLAEVCSETLRRLIRSEPVSDRYLLGLAWYLRNAVEQRKEKA